MQWGGVVSVPNCGITAHGRIVEVVDGDTVKVRALGLGVTVRLKDCWAPELHKFNERHKQAGRWSKEFLARIAAPGALCRVQVSTEEIASVDEDDWEIPIAKILTFGRVVGSIWLNGDDETLTDHMTKAGYAIRWHRKPEEFAINQLVESIWGKHR